MLSAYNIRRAAAATGSDRASGCIRPAQRALSSDPAAVSYTHLFRDRLTLSDPLSIFLGGTKPYINIQTDNQAKKNLLIFTDGNLGAMSQFLTIHYDDITIVDLSYLTEYYRDSIDFDRYDNVLFYYSTPSMQDPDKFGKLSLFSK